MGQADMKGDRVLVWDSCMDRLLDWSLLLGMLMGLSRILLGMMLSVDNVQNLTQARAFSHLLRWQGVDSGFSFVHVASSQALRVPLCLNGLDCSARPPWVPVFMI